MSHLRTTALLLLATALAAVIVGVRGTADAPPPDALDLFQRGSTAYARALELEAGAQTPAEKTEAEARALALMEDAVAAWRLAATTRSDWPAARRNLERALLGLARLRGTKREGGPPRPVPLPLVPGEPGPGDPPPPQGPSPLPTPSEPPGPTTATPSRVEAGELAPAAVRGLFDILREQESRKNALRRERRIARGAEVERDW